MADTIRADYKKTPCSDCAETGQVFMKHWGVLVPPGTTGFFCPTCWAARTDDYRQGREIRQLGVRAKVEKPE